MSPSMIARLAGTAALSVVLLVAAFVVQVDVVVFVLLIVANAAGYAEGYLFRALDRKDPR